LIGIFDSGLGGLSALAEVRRLLPWEDIIYFGDTGRVPYGSRSRETIIKYALQDMRFLADHSIDAVLVACGTVSSNALEVLREEYPEIPIIGVIDAGARAALKATKNKRIGISGTPSTIASGAYEKAVRRLDPTVEVFSAACPLFVPLVEEGWLDREATKMVVKEYLTPLKMAGIDTLVLGCTHYPLLSKVIGEFLGPEVKLVDSASACAAELESILKEKSLLRSEGSGSETFFVTDGAAKFSETGSRFLGRDLQAIKFTPSR